MAFPTAVNDQITDAVTQSNVKVLGEAPAVALGQLYQSLAQASATAAQNAVTNQQNANQVALAVTTRCVQSLVRGSAGSVAAEQE
ncbi:RebB family R body protein [Dyella acidiphila]|uniref:RebB family R body protein n=1 Tax=Dyella acidiphila TaxID=2775866 RepID=A0ABR9G9K2_9GAMM|nr:RebB family R body protein [Dyella acidiphila]MBE1160727.1 RebB family R body protein [Dyella acidiphila]